MGLIMSLGENIKRLRRDLGLTQEELAKKTGIKSGHISKLERDETDPKLSTIYKLMQELGCSANTLLMDDDKIGFDGLLTVAFERASNLPEQEKAIMIDLIDKYCMANGMEKMFENNKWKFMWNTGKIDRLLNKA